MSEILGITAIVAAILAALIWYVWGSVGATLGAVEVLEQVGGLAKWDVRIADVAGRRTVQLVLGEQGDNGEVEVQMFLTATQARLLSQWMRLAASRGRTLADARRRSPG